MSCSWEVAVTRLLETVLLQGALSNTTPMDDVPCDLAFFSEAADQGMFECSKRLRILNMHKGREI